MARKQEANKRLRDGQLALWALELVYPHPPQKQGNVARGSGTMAIQPDGTVCIDGSEVQLTDEWGRPFYLRFKMRVYEGIDEVVERDPHLIGALLALVLAILLKRRRERAHRVGNAQSHNLR